MTAPWNSPERDITPEHVVLSRRKWLKRAGGVAGALAIGGGVAWWLRRDGTDQQIIEAGQVGVLADPITPAQRNADFAGVDRPLTNEAAAARYCNFYEFSSTKQVWRYVDSFEPLPWTIEVSGLVAHPRTYDIDSLLSTFPLEERVYRHRCVETWAMVIPWVGFPLRELLRRAEPLPGARFVRFETFQRPAQATRQQFGDYPWPYNEGLSLQEATNELAFIATGMYGHPLLKQHGAPIRLVVPWKYGFKSAKSIVRIELTAQQPATFWNTLAANEYDFWANVDPLVPHPRWSQETEWMLDTRERFPSRVYNGYGQYVGHLYRQLKRFFF